MPKLSVLIYANQPYREHLPFCLEMLSRQRFKDFEVLLAGDAAEGNTDSVAKVNIQRLAPADSFAAAFNLAAKAAAGTGLVCLNASTLLNPEALGSYARYLAGPGHRLVFGYIGAGSDRTEPGPAEPQAPSLWFPAQQVAYLDYRIIGYRRDGLLGSDYLPEHPHWFATGTNFAIQRDLALELGCDESLSSSRYACVDLAYRAQAQGQRIDFLLDTWAEQLLHPQARLQRPPRRYRPLPVQEPARLIFTAQGKRILLEQLFGHYFQQDPQHDGPGRHRLSQPDAAVDLPNDFYAMIGHYQLNWRPTDARPAFLIIGAQKAGTTSLHNYFAEHPQCLPPRIKEIHFFNRDENFIQGPDWYLDHFRFESGKLSYETTPAYLFDEQVPARIGAFAPAIRLIAILREPVARAFSAWNMYRKMPPHHYLHEARSFEQTIGDALSGDPTHGYLERGRYIEQIQRYLQYFPREQLLLLDFDELTGNPDASLARCSAFLDLNPPLQLPEDAKKVYNAGKYRESLPEEIKDRLQAYFSPFNRQLREAFDLDYAWLV
ncbi:MAG: sulfotransferase domain-containing protein [Candidatus Sericytochromatia bacterium]